MHVTEEKFDVKAIQASWHKFDAMVQLRPIHNKADYNRMVSFMNKLLDVVGDDEEHDLSGLLDLVSDLVWRYEQANYAIEAAEPKDVLRFLLESRNLKQEDLSAIVQQSNLSAILSGKRKISAALAGKLGKFFDVSPAAFIPA